ncbi:hypothetical protein L1987_16345 [Smallanthus sonchifolius]|uniref:Uncharacterized protein n=1 Tax=Smallanthus sonchifolius TaxID=185202 RepID=A0ACB9JBK4_9ASTR|nr:hypothetical protein L1987_16345 [Smallanthus sonchifolius]
MSIQLYKQMVENNMYPDNYTLPYVLKACAYVECFRLGEMVHVYCLKLGFVFDRFVRNTLMLMYSLFVKMMDARKVFDEMPVRCVVSWTVLISGYGKIGDVEVARLAFDAAPVKDRGIWGAVISGYVQNNCFKEGLEMFRLIQSTNILPDEAKFVSVLGACAHLGALEIGIWVHKLVDEVKLKCDMSHSGMEHEGLRLFNKMCDKYNINPKPEHYICIIDLVGRAGLFSEAKDIIQRMPNSCSSKDSAVAWRSLLSACQSHKQMELAQMAAEKLMELENDSGVYVLMSNLYSSTDDRKSLQRTRRDHTVYAGPANNCRFISLSAISRKQMYRHMAAATIRGGQPTDSSDAVVTLDKVPRWSDGDFRYSYEIEDPNFSNMHFPDPLASSSGEESMGKVSRFPVDHEVNSKIYLWNGNPWNLEVDAVVNSTNETLDEAHCSPGLHAAAGPDLAEECATLGGCRTGMAKVTNAYDLPARRVIHTVGPKYAVKYHTAAENALSHCYRSCLELLIETGLQSIAMGCIYTEAKNYPREPAAHVAIRTVRRFLEKQKDKITGVVFCLTTENDTEIYKRLLPLYFPRDKKEEAIAISKLPADVGDENGPKPPRASLDVPVSEQGSPRRNSSYLESYLDPAFMSIIKDPDQRRQEQWERTARAQNGFNFAKMLGFGDLGGPSLSACF